MKSVPVYVVGAVVGRVTSNFLTAGRPSTLNSDTAITCSRRKVSHYQKTLQSVLLIWLPPLLQQ